MTTDQLSAKLDALLTMSEYHMAVEAKKAKLGITKQRLMALTGWNSRKIDNLVYRGLIKKAKNRDCYDPASYFELKSIMEDV